MVLLVGAVAAFIVSAFALSGASIEEDPSSLGKVSTDTFGAAVEKRHGDRGEERRRRPGEDAGRSHRPDDEAPPGRGSVGRGEGEAASVIGASSASEKTLTTTVIGPDRQSGSALA